MPDKPVRFRPHQAILLAALVAFIGAFPLVFGPDLTEGAGAPRPGSTLRWYLLPALLAPLLVALWAFRAGTDVDAEGLRLRALFGQRQVPWSEVTALGADQRGRAVAQLRDGNQVRLPAVRATDLPRVISASGQQLETAQQAEDR